MTFIFPVYELATQCFHQTETFCEHYGLTPVDSSVCSQIIEALIEDELNSRMIWCDDSEYITTALTENINWYHSDYRNNPVSDHYYQEVIDEFFVQVSQLINEFVGVKTWRVWYTKRSGQDMFIEKGDDFRVIEYERRVMSGELPVNDKIKKALGVDIDR